jgi:hypothetical protein
MEFMAGLVFGAIFGVVADRVFTYLVEKKVFVKIQAVFGQHIEKGDYLSLQITNVGFESLPPYKVALYNPHSGTFFIFDHETKTERCPGQSDEFFITVKSLIKDKNIYLPWFTGIHSAPLNNASNSESREMTANEFQEWQLRLVVDGGEDRILYHNNTIGVALVEVLRDTIQNGYLNATGEQAHRMSVTTNPWVSFKEWRNTRKVLRELGIHTGK